MNVRFNKILRDLFISKSRTILAVLALAIGIAGVGFSLTAYTILSREIDKNYMRTNPASFVLETEKIDKEFIEELKKNPLIDDVELRKEVKGRYKKGENDWITISLFVIEDFKDIRIDKVSSEIGEWPAKDREILLERAGIRMIDSNIGDNITIRLPNEKEAVLKYSGQAYAPGLAPAWMEGMLYGFITLNTYRQSGGKGGLNELHIIVKDNRLDKGEITKAAYAEKSRLKPQAGQLRGFLSQNPGNILMQGR